VKAISVGGQNCQILDVRSNVISFLVPPWPTVNTNDQNTFMTNAMDVLVVTKHGVAIQTNAVTFNRTLPVEHGFESPLTQDELELKQLVDGLIYDKRVLGTNLTIEPSFTLNASVGKKAKTPDNPVTAGAPGVSVTVIYTNAAATQLKNTSTATNAVSQ
jgi:hypothetical protein